MKNQSLSLLCAICTLGIVVPMQSLVAQSQSEETASPLMMLRPGEQKRPEPNRKLTPEEQDAERQCARSETEDYEGEKNVVVEEQNIQQMLEEDICKNIYTACLARVAALTLNRTSGMELASQEAREWAAAEAKATNDIRKCEKALEKAKKEKEIAEKKLNSATASLHGKAYADEAYYNFQIKELMETLEESRLTTAEATRMAIFVRGTAQSSGAEAELEAAMKAEQAAKAAYEKATQEPQILREKEVKISTESMPLQSKEYQGIEKLSVPQTPERIENLVEKISLQDQETKIEDEEALSKTPKGKAYVELKNELFKIKSTIPSYQEVLVKGGSRTQIISDCNLIIEKYGRALEIIKKLYAIVPLNKLQELQNQQEEYEKELVLWQKRKEFCNIRLSLLSQDKLQEQLKLVEYEARTGNRTKISVKDFYPQAANCYKKIQKYAQKAQEGLQEGEEKLGSVLLLGKISQLYQQAAVSYHDVADVYDETPADSGKLQDKIDAQRKATWPKQRFAQDCEEAANEAAALLDKAAEAAEKIISAQKLNNSQLTDEWKNVEQECQRVAEIYITSLGKSITEKQLMSYEREIVHLLIEKVECLEKIQAVASGDPTPWEDVRLKIDETIGSYKRAFEDYKNGDANVGERFKIGAEVLKSAVSSLSKKAEFIDKAREEKLETIVSLWEEVARKYQEKAELQLEAARLYQAGYQKKADELVKDKNYYDSPVEKIQGCIDELNRKAEKEKC